MSESIQTFVKNPPSYAYLTEATYRAWYEESITQPDIFWAKHAKELITWALPWTQVKAGHFAENNCEWFVGAKLNITYNCLDRHLKDHSNRVAIIWESDDANQSLSLTFAELHERVCRFANVLKNLGVKRQDKVCIYLPMIPEAAIAMLACARIGAIHSVVFAGFSALALKARIIDADCHLVITANEGLRGGKTIPLKENVDEALKDCPNVKNVIVVKRTETRVQFNPARDHWYHQLMLNAQSDCLPTIMNAQDSLFILYTSGSTGKPKGILHSTGGYAVFAAMTFKYIFNYQSHEIYWCSADVGWITGHTYGIYGPLLNTATTLMFEGIPTFKTPARLWEIIDKHQVNIFYTAPTAIRALRREGDDWVKKTSRKTLRLLGTVGEPINPEAWEWYYHLVGEERCPIVDTWWQTETGGIMISPFPYATALKPGSASLPFFGVQAKIVDDKGKEVPQGQMGKLVITAPWPGMMQTIYGDPARFMQTYFAEFPGYYLTGDQAKRDQDGYFWIAGRSDDVIKVSGHRIGTQEVESALVSHVSVAEAAVVAVADVIKGQHIYAFVTLRAGFHASDALKGELIATVRKVIGPIAQPQTIQWADNLPKTRSGKIMRRLLRKIANNDTNDLGDLSTLAEPKVVEALVKDK